eukprot:gene11798-5132_t
MQKKRKQVTRACKKCKQSHACCDNQRPCSRCVNLGLADSCCDSEQKKRGRKRKEEEVQETSPIQKMKKPEQFKQEQSLNGGSVWQTNFSVPEDYPIFNDSSINEMMKSNDENTSFELELKLQGLKTIVEQQKKEIEDLKRENEELEEEQNLDKQKIMTTFNANAFKYAFESSSFSMILTSSDGEGRILSHNNAFKKLLGLTEDISISSLSEIVDPEDWKKAMSTHIFCLNHNQSSYNLKLKLKKADGESITVITHNDILSDENSKPLFCLNIMTEKV